MFNYINTGAVMARMMAAHWEKPGLNCGITKMDVGLKVT
jgi:hypothetical protein